MSEILSKMLPAGWFLADGQWHLPGFPGEARCGIAHADEAPLFSCKTDIGARLVPTHAEGRCVICELLCPDLPGSAGRSSDPARPPRPRLVRVCGAVTADVLCGAPVAPDAILCIFHGSSAPSGNDAVSHRACCGLPRAPGYAGSTLVYGVVDRERTMADPVANQMGVPKRSCGAPAVGEMRIPFNATSHTSAQEIIYLCASCRAGMDPNHPAYASWREFSKSSQPRKVDLGPLPSAAREAMRGLGDLAAPMRRDEAVRTRLRELVTVSFYTIAATYGLLPDRDCATATKAQAQLAPCARRLQAMAQPAALPPGLSPAEVVFVPLANAPSFRAHWFAVPLKGPGPVYFDFASYVSARDLARLIDRLTVDPLCGR